MGAACAFKRHDAVIVVEKLFEKHKQKARTSQTKTPQLQLKSIKVQDLLSELTIVSKKK
jgi:hypothetical protein